MHVWFVPITKYWNVWKTKMRKHQGRRQDEMYLVANLVFGRRSRMKSMSYIGRKIGSDESEE